MARFNYSYASVPMFDGTNYVVWCSRTEVYLSSLGYDVWISVMDGYSVFVTPPTNPNVKREYECNVEAKKVILNGLPDIVSSKVKKCKFAKDIWNRLKKIYGEEPSNAGSYCRRKKNKGADKYVDDESGSISCYYKDEKETHLFGTRRIR